MDPPVVAQGLFLGLCLRLPLMRAEDPAAYVCPARPLQELGCCPSLIHS